MARAREIGIQFNILRMEWYLQSDDKFSSVIQDCLLLLEVGGWQISKEERIEAS